MIKRGMYVFATGDCAEGLADARAFIKERGYTRDDVRLVRSDGMLIVVAKRNLDA